MLDQQTIRHIHCIGIGGIGVGGIADFLLRKGFKVTGSDVKPNKVTRRLEAMGATIFMGHKAQQVGDADLVVYSSAINPGNPEFQLAKQRGIHLLQRAEMLAELMDDSVGIAISGTHGKTTTTSLTAAILLAAGLDPSFMVGGLFNQMESPAGLGAGEYFVAEADESDASFLQLHPTVAVVTNIDHDHMGTYQDSFTTLTQTFAEFLAKLPTHGLAVLCADNSAALALQAACRAPSCTFGFSESADFCAYDFKQTDLCTVFRVKRPDGLPDLVVKLNLPGRHNVLNALAAIAVAHHIGVSDAAVQQALLEFSGVGRRFHVHHAVKVAQGEVTVVDDYGHHPEAVSATLAAARLAWPARRVVLAFQPHRYTRTRDLLDDFAQALSAADEVFLLPVFAAGDSPIAGATSEDLAAKMTSPVTVLTDLDQLVPTLSQQLHDGDVVILQGAGDIGTLVAEFV